MGFKVGDRVRYVGAPGNFTKIGLGSVGTVVDNVDCRRCDYTNLTMDVRFDLPAPTWASGPGGWAHVTPTGFELVIEIIDESQGPCAMCEKICGGECYEKWSY